MARIIPKKRLGQHFLQDDAITAQIVNSLNYNATHRTIIEVGPGTGALTTQLIERATERLFVVEIDTTLIPHLTAQYKKLAERIIEADFLTIPIEQYWKGPLAIIGNFPYNISTQIFFKILQHRDQVEEVVCMLQQEVAARIAAPPGSKVYGILSVLTQAFYNVEYLFTVSSEVFHPPPKVQSAVIRLRRNQVGQLPCEETTFFRVVKMGFQQRRKKLRNALKALLPDSNLKSPLLEQRAEQLTVENFVTLTQLMSA